MDPRRRTARRSPLYKSGASLFMLPGIILVVPERIALSSLVSKTSTLSVELWDFGGETE